MRKGVRKGVGEEGSEEGCEGGREWGKKGVNEGVREQEKYLVQCCVLFSLLLLVTPSSWLSPQQLDVCV